MMFNAIRANAKGMPKIEINKMSDAKGNKITSINPYVKHFVGRVCRESVAECSFFGKSFKKINPATNEYTKFIKIPAIFDPTNKLCTRRPCMMLWNMEG